MQSILSHDLSLPISILVPAYNEGASIAASVRSFLTLHYPEFEVIVVNDGSTDETLQILIDVYELYEIRWLDRPRVPSKEVKRVYRSLRYPNLVVMDKLNGGKADATNAALNIAKYDVVCAVDADSLLDNQALVRSARLFLEDETTVAVGASIRPLNGATIEDGIIDDLKLSPNFLARMQIIEYSRAFFVRRSGWAALDTLMIISGAFGLFKRDLMLELNGWSTDTITEDIELMIRIHQYYRDRNLPYRIDFIPEPLCWTEVPEDIGSLRRQRNRWQRGLLEVLWMHRKLIFNPRYGRIGLLGLPYFLLVEALSPIIELGGYIFVIVAVIFNFLAIEIAIGLAVLSLLYGTTITQLAMGVETLLIYRYKTNWERLILILSNITEFLGYRQIMLLERFIATFQVNAKRGQWGAMRRVGIK